MKPKKVIAPKLFKLPLLKEYDAIVIGRYMVFKHEPDDLLLKHEMIHQEQMDRHGVIGFYFLYLYHYIRLRITGHNHDTAYHGNPLEKEAYSRQNEK